MGTIYKQLYPGLDLVVDGLQTYFIFDGYKINMTSVLGNRGWAAYGALREWTNTTVQNIQAENKQAEQEAKTPEVFPNPTNDPRLA